MKDTFKVVNDVHISGFMSTEFTMFTFSFNHNMCILSFTSNQLENAPELGNEGIRNIQ